MWDSIIKRENEYYDSICELFDNIFTEIFTLEQVDQYNNSVNNNNNSVT